MEKGGILAVGGGNGKDFYTGSSLKRHHSSKDIKLESKSCSSLGQEDTRQMEEQM